MSLAQFMTGVQHVGIPTNDLGATIAFYESLGFRNVYRTVNQASGEAVCFLRMQNLCIEAFENGQAALRPGAVDHIAIDVTDIDEAYRAVQELGCPFLRRAFPACPSGRRGFGILY